MNEQERHLWIPEFEVDHEQLTGQEWPVVVVQKWETNGIGERRFVGTRSYRSVDPDESLGPLYELSGGPMNGNSVWIANHVHTLKGPWGGEYRRQASFVWVPDED